MTDTVAKTSAAPAIVRSQVAVDGVRFAVDRIEPRRRRRTTPTLLLHGVPETSRMWHPLLQELGRDRIAIAPDLKGLGESELREPYDIPTLVRELAVLVLHEVDGPVDVVGHDWGGSLGLVLAATRPDLVRRLVVINAPFRQVDYSRAWHMPFFALPVVPELAYALGGRAIVRRMLGHGWRASQPIDPDLQEHYAAAYADPARVRAMLAYYRGAVRPRLLKMAKRRAQRLRGRGSSLPPARIRPEAALVIWGAADPILPLRIGESVVNDLGPETRFVGLPGIGHFAVDEAPGLVTASVASFLREDITPRARSDA